jgi:hypothetical protein
VGGNNMNNTNLDIRDHLQLTEDFLYKRINEEEYMERRGNYKKWGEAEILAQDPKTFIRLLQQLRRVFRVNLMRELNELDIRDIIKMLISSKTNSNSSISKYFNYEKKKMEQESRPRRIAQLAIILDVPYLFALQDTCTLFHEFDDFIEFKITTPDVIHKETIDKYINPVKFRDITGLGIINKQSWFPFQTEITYVRIDRRQNFFTIEFYIREDSEITFDILIEIIKSLRLNCIQNALLTTAFLRKGYKKLILVGSQKLKIPTELYSYVEKLRRRKQTLEFNLVSIYRESEKKA